MTRRRTPTDTPTASDSRRGQARRAESRLDPGARIGDYIVRRPLARGGFGIVFEVVHATTERPAALKLLDAQHVGSATTRVRFEREARLLADLAHPNIVEILAIGETSWDQPYFVMELLAGRDLSSHLKAHGRLSTRDTVAIVDRVVGALGAAHDAGVIHRDIKPSNVFLTTDPARRAVLLDFGIAKPLGSSTLTRTNQLVGTPGHMAPEQLAFGTVDVRTDIYQLGVLMFQMLTARMPDAGPPSRYAPSIPAAIDALVLRATRVDPVARHPSVRELAAELRAAAGDPGAKARTLPALAVHVTIRTSDEIVDPALTLGPAREAMTALGFAVAATTGNSALFVRAIDEPERASLIEAARGALVGREVRFHAGPVEWEGSHPVGGPVMVLDWLV